MPGNNHHDAGHNNRALPVPVGADAIQPDAQQPSPNHKPTEELQTERGRPAHLFRPVRPSPSGRLNPTTFTMISTRARTPCRQPPTRCLVVAACFALVGSPPQPGPSGEP